jgi:hypothetical protein
MSPFYFGLEKRKGMSKRLGTNQHFFQNPKKETAPGCWIMQFFFQNLRKSLLLGAGSHDQRQPKYKKVKNKTPPDGIYLHWLIMLSIAVCSHMFIF